MKYGLCRVTGYFGFGVYAHCLLDEKGDIQKVFGYSIYSSDNIHVGSANTFEGAVANLLDLCEVFRKHSNSFQISVKAEIDRISRRDFSKLKENKVVSDENIIGVAVGLIDSIFSFFCAMINSGDDYDEEAFECLSKVIDSILLRLENLKPKSSLKL